jgi:hypothetical protein
LIFSRPCNQHAIPRGKKVTLAWNRCAYFRVYPLSATAKRGVRLASGKRRLLMRYMFALALLPLLAAVPALASEAPSGSFPVTKCDPFSGGSLCATFDGTRVMAAHGMKTSAVPAHGATRG